MESDNNVVLVHLLEEWVKEMKEEIKSIHRCGDTLRTEVSNLKQEVTKFSTLNDAFIESKLDCTKKHDDHESRIREMESCGHNVKTNKELAKTNINNLEKIVTTKIDSVVLDTKKNSDNWVYTVRYLIVSTLAILGKIIFF